MANRFEKILVAALFLGLVSCSSSPEGEEGDESFLDEAAPTEEASTDAVTEEKPAEELASSTEQAPVEPAAPVDAPVAPAPIADEAPSNSAGTYTVQAGDTLMKIAFETTGDIGGWKRLLEMNRDQISNANNIPVGITLKTESTGFTPEKNGTAYRIKQGDTLGKISSDVYGTPTKWRKIYDNNRQLIKDPNKIYAGFFLYYAADEGGSVVGNTTEPANSAPAADGNLLESTDAGREPASANK